MAITLGFDPREEVSTTSSATIRPTSTMVSALGSEPRYICSTQVSGAKSGTFRY